MEFFFGKYKVILERLKKKLGNKDNIKELLKDYDEKIRVIKVM